jgi:hypothetical protein
LQEIHHGAFRGTALTSISFTRCQAVTTIRIGVFDDCTSLEVVDLSENIKTIEWRAFENCTSLNSDYLKTQDTGKAITFRGSDEDAFFGARPISIKLNFNGNLLTITDWADSSRSFQEIAARQYPDIIRNLEWEYIIPEGKPRETAYNEFENGEWNHLWATEPWQMSRTRQPSTSTEDLNHNAAKRIKYGASFTDLCTLRPCTNPER